MIVLRAQEMGMCFGVRDALETLDAVQRPDQVTIHGQLVHNPAVQRRLTRRGFASSSEVRRDVPATPAVMITAHGISDRERRRLHRAGKQLVDTTCPLVEKVHEVARALSADYRRLVVLGKRGHVEVRGITEDHPDAVVVETEADAVPIHADRLGVVCQTTCPKATVDHLLAAVRRANPRADVRFVDTVCAPTKARQDALEELMDRVDALVVVGGLNSNNTRQLVAAAVRRGLLAMQVESPSDLDKDRLRGCAVVGLTAGTSTLPETIDAVDRALRALG